MTLETMTKAEAEAKSAGEGREDPNKNPTLEEPKYVCNKLHGDSNFIISLNYRLHNNLDSEDSSDSLDISFAL